MKKLVLTLCVCSIAASSVVADIVEETTVEIQEIQAVEADIAEETVKKIEDSVIEEAVVAPEATEEVVAVAEEAIEAAE